MALFFDSVWFDAKLAAVHLSRSDLARALGIPDTAIAEIWKDQRELTAQDVSIIAALLGASPIDVATHAGISTPVPHSTDTTDIGRSLAALSARLERVEQLLIEMKTLLRDPDRGSA